MLRGVLRFASGLLQVVSERTRFQLPNDPVPSAWSRIVQRNVPLSDSLSADERERLLRLAQLFLKEIPIEGCGDLVLDDEMRVTIAATASMLVLNLPYPRFPRVKRVLLYPETYVPVRPEFRRHASIELDDSEPLAGEAWMDGIVVLSWSDVLEDATTPDDGHNVVLHEFAHILDGEDGSFNGMPILEGASPSEEWGDVIEGELEAHRRAIDDDREAALRDYAASDAAEFFAVATEVFFEMPEYLRERLPSVYEQLRRYYRQDPAARGTGGPAR